MSENWVALLVHHIPVGWGPIDPTELEMLFLEEELQAAGIEVAFDPRRPGDNYTSRSVAMDLRLLVKESDLARAQQVLSDVSQQHAE